MSTVVICNNLSMNVENMKAIHPSESFICIEKVRKANHPILPKNINWSTVDRNAWFICIRPDNNYSYSFPICESENRENDFKRVRDGLKWFHEQKYLTFKIQ